MNFWCRTKQNIDSELTIAILLLACRPVVSNLVVSWPASLTLSEHFKVVLDRVEVVPVQQILGSRQLVTTNGMMTRYSKAISDRLGKTQT